MFDVLADDAGRVVNAIFPRYYEFGEVLGFTALKIGPLVLIALAAIIYAHTKLIPKMEEADDDDFAKYHG